MKPWPRLRSWTPIFEQAGGVCFAQQWVGEITIPGLLPRFQCRLEAQATPDDGV